MEPLALKLEILKGPRKGETLEYRPGSKIRIGRVVRGNNLPIKDSGISTNHLIIDSESGQWMLRDLDSSNGTILNDTAVTPNTPFELTDGDEIKIGEYTSISVRIEGNEEESRLRRNPRRAAVVKVGTAAANRGRRGKVAKESEVVQDEVKPEVEIESHEEIGGGEDRAPARRGRGRKKNEVESALELVEVVDKLKRGRGRPKKARVLESEGDLVEGVAVPEVSSRAAAGSKNVVEELENCGVECEQVKVEPKRRGRKKKNVQEEQKDLGEIVPAVVNGKDDRGVVLEQEHLREIGPDDDGKGSTLGDERHEEAAVGFEVGENGDTNEKAKDSNLGNEEPTVGFGVGESGNDSEKAKESNLGHEEVAIDCNVGEGDKVESASRSCSGVSGANGSLGKIWQEEPDLEKMTLDDWFDYVEVSWPKVVNDEIDKICAGMREKARLVQEYIAQHKKEKGQS